MRWSLVFALVLAAARVHAEPVPVARPADAVALLPLDADARLELYGQPVASELARALVAGGIDVVVVGPKMAVPERARLVVDGTIKLATGDAVSIAVRVRDRTTGTVLDRLEAGAPSLMEIDRAASDLAARVLPSVRAQLAARTEPPRVPLGAKPAAKPAAATGDGHPMRWPGVQVTLGTGVEHGALQDALVDELPRAGERHGVFGSASGPAVAFSLDAVTYDVESGTVPVARARVHVKIVVPPKVVFDRVVVTDTVVGDKGLALDQLAARTARAVLDILEPHLRRAIEAWK